VRAAFAPGGSVGSDASDAALGPSWVGDAEFAVGGVVGLADVEHVQGLRPGRWL